MLTHVVVMKFSDRTHVTRARKLLSGMSGRIATLRDVEVHLDSLQAAGAFDLCLITRFDDAAGLTAYQTDPVHLEVAAWLKTVLAERAVVDYET